MRFSRHAALLALGILMGCGSDRPLTSREDETRRAGLEAFTYGFPLVEMARTRFVMAGTRLSPVYAPLNTLRHGRTLSDASSRAVVAPNTDTVYSSAWLDLGVGPIRLDLPPTGGRYYSVQFLDAYTNTFRVISRQSPGGAGGRYVVVGPSTTGAPPEGYQILRAPTDMVWMLARFLVDGPEDLPEVRQIQDAMRLTPPSGSEPRAIDRPETGGLGFFRSLNRLLAENPPPPTDAAILARLGAVGIGPGLAFDPTAETRAGFERAVEDGLRQVTQPLAAGRPTLRGWTLPQADLGDYGTNYDLRALVAKQGLGALVPSESVYLTTRIDSEGKPLDGRNAYVLRFPPGDLPPANAFWSLTLYGPDGFFVENDRKRHAIGDRSQGLARDGDGGLSLFVGLIKPANAPEANWLPAPAGPFSLMLRAYEPKADIREGRWAPQALRRLD